MEEKGERQIERDRKKERGRRGREREKLLTAEASSDCLAGCGYHATALISYLFCLASFLSAVSSLNFSESWSASKLTTAIHF